MKSHFTVKLVKGESGAAVVYAAVIAVNQTD
jgi:hypothetical protein